MLEIEKTFAGRPLRIETGRLAKQAAGSALAQFGDTMVLVAVTVSHKSSPLPFFPLTVEYREKTYAAGKFPGGFIKREGRPADSEIVAARIIDRSLRPLFPKGFQNEVQVFAYVISSDQENAADVVALNAASVALSVSPVPWQGPVASVRVGRVNGEFVLNPTFAQLEDSDLDIVVAGNAESIQMVEGGSLELPEGEILGALAFAQKGLAELVEFQRELISQATQPKMEWTKDEAPEELRNRVYELATDRVKAAINRSEKSERSKALSDLRDEIVSELTEDFSDDVSHISGVLDEIEAATMRTQILETGERIDGRDGDTVRPITCEVSFVARAHGSALFTRGQTQALVSATLGSVSDEQRVDTIHSREQTSKSFMLHYNFPPFSVGEVRPIRGVSRREIGHGVLAERALQVLLPPYEEFPYTIRLVSEILESNGSSSMATVCGGSLALMDAGVPIKSACAGVAMGLVKEGDRVAVLTDILGSEDHLGDMDFKVAGTRDGITSIQMDIKIDGLKLEVLKGALEKAQIARFHILDTMARTLGDARAELSDYAPRIISIQVNPERIGEIIGPKGKTIRGIQEKTGADVNIDDSGVVTIASIDGHAGEEARAMVEALVEEPEVGKVYEGLVKGTTQFGAFVEILPGTEGLLHISELQHNRTERTEDVVKKGDQVRVKLMAIDDRGKMKLSRKALIEKE
ncbi:MAG: polyribonucleotide nucleotidyltransferase [Gemmatimonadales bacterium]